MLVVASVKFQGGEVNVIILLQINLSVYEILCRIQSCKYFGLWVSPSLEGQSCGKIGKALAWRAILLVHPVDTVYPNKITMEGKPVQESNKPYVLDQILDIETDMRTSIQPKSKIIFQTDNLTVINDNILTTDKITPQSIDLIITSPPYNVDISYNSHDDHISYHDYLEFSRKWMSKCYSFSKDDARFCLNIPLDKNKNGQQSVGADLTTIAKEIGWKYHSTIVWNEGNISRRTAWGSWLSASAPYVIAPVELIVILYKNNWKKANRLGESDISRQDFMDWTNGLWTFTGESKKRIGHPAPFPRELPRRCIKLFSYVGDTVLDPFMGSGTTLVEIFLNHRKGIGVDIDKTYCKLAEKRIREYSDTLLPV